MSTRQRTKDLLSVILVCLCVCHQAHALQVTGGRVMDVVVADSGRADSTFGTFFLMPTSFDIDKSGNLYVLDQLSEKVLKFDRYGKWKSALGPLSKSGEWEGHLLTGMAIDNCGNIYAAKAKKIMKFSSQGKFLLESEDIKIGLDIMIDKAGRIYDPRTHDGIVVYDKDLKLREVIKIDAYEYIDNGIVQKEAGNDIYFRQNKYLYRTSLEEYSRNRKIDTVAVLPKELTNPRFLIKRTSEKYPPPPDLFCPFIGFDRDSFFYFYTEDWDSEKQRKDICKSYTIFKYRLEKGELKKTGEIKIDFDDYNAECSEKSLEYENTALFLRVAGDGTIYWIHGTVDTVKVSKIIMDEYKPTAK